MIIVISFLRSLFHMRAIVLLIGITAGLFFASSGAYAVKFSFDPSSGTPLMAANYALPSAIIAVASILGAIIIAFERKKAKGIWFSDGERLK